MGRRSVITPSARTRRSSSRREPSGVTGCFAQRDGHLREIAYHPGFESVRMGGPTFPDGAGPSTVTARRAIPLATRATAPGPTARTGSHEYSLNRRDCLSVTVVLSGHRRNPLESLAVVAPMAQRTGAQGAALFAATQSPLQRQDPTGAVVLRRSKRPRASCHTPPMRAHACQSLRTEAG